MPATATSGDTAPPSPPAPSPWTPEHDGESSRRRKVLVIAGVVFSIATFSVWIYALFFYDPGLMIDELQDRTFPKAAEEICHQARVKIEALPTAEQTKDPADRADVVDQANDALRTMTAQLQATVPTGSTAKETRIYQGVRQWVTDWNTYIGDRQDYADSLRENPDTRFTETLKSNRQISRAIDAFAQVNRMDSCSVPGDVG